VPASFANQPVSLRIYPKKIVLVAEGQVLCEHDRIITRSHRLPGRTIYDWRHYLAVIQRKPGALRNGAPFVEMPALVLQHDEQAVLCAVELALEVPVCRREAPKSRHGGPDLRPSRPAGGEAGVPTKTHVLNLLHRLIDGKSGKEARVDIPEALALQREPKANVARYDSLRRKESARAS
jgi:hypothetical protein